MTIDKLAYVNGRWPKVRVTVYCCKCYFVVRSQKRKKLSCTVLSPLATDFGSTAFLFLMSWERPTNLETARCDCHRQKEEQNYGCNFVNIGGVFSVQKMSLSTTKSFTLLCTATTHSRYCMSGYPKLDKRVEKYSASQWFIANVYCGVGETQTRSCYH